MQNITRVIHQNTSCAACHWPISKGETCLFRLIKDQDKERVDVYCCQKCYDDPTLRYENQVVS